MMAFSTATVTQGATFYLDAKTGDDANDGKSQKTAWQTLERANQRNYVTGDQLLLRKGQTFVGTVSPSANGTAEQPIVIDAYGDGALPIIDARGYLAGVRLNGCRYVEVSNLEISADAGKVVQAEAKHKRYGVLVTAREGGERQHFHFKNLYIHDIFATEQVPSDGKAATSNAGMGFDVLAGGDEKSFASDILIEGCTIERTGKTGIGVHCANQDRAFHNDNIRIVDNTLKTIGGPGIQPGRCNNVLVRGNVVDGTGSSADKRMHARGSGMWPWTCNDILVEHNKFMHARGKADSCGIHIDFNCANVIIQYNLSLDNDGGFVEILGNCHNCAYRYNVSINDGRRIKGQGGAHQAGKTLWFSSFTGKARKRVGPFNSYIYNNTIFVKDEMSARFSLATTTKGAIVANNIFHVPAGVKSVGGDQDNRREPKGAKPQNVIFRNNVYTNELPMEGFTDVIDNILADPQYKKAGSFDPADYVPANASVLKDKSIKITPLPGDKIGLTLGLEVETDFFGNKIRGAADIGAIEMD